MHLRCTDVTYICYKTYVTQYITYNNNIQYRIQYSMVIIYLMFTLYTTCTTPTVYRTHTIYTVYTRYTTHTMYNTSVYNMYHTLCATRTTFIYDKERIYIIYRFRKSNILLCAYIYTYVYCQKCIHIYGQVTGATLEFRRSHAQVMCTQRATARRAPKVAASFQLQNLEGSRIFMQQYYTSK